MAPRRTDWADTRISFTVASGSQTTNTLIGSFAVHETGGMTLTRCLVSLDVVSNAVTGTDGIMHVDWGIATASQEAFAAGVVSDPDTQADHPIRGWVGRGSLLVGQDNANVLQPRTVRLDLRSQRKIDGSELFLVVDANSLLGAAFTIRVAGLVRCLCLMP